jgi:hypothetical protein
VVARVWHGMGGPFSAGGSRYMIVSRWHIWQFMAETLPQCRLSDQPENKQNILLLQG